MSGLFKFGLIVLLVISILLLPMILFLGTSTFFLIQLKYFIRTVFLCLICFGIGVIVGRVTKKTIGE